MGIVGEIIDKIDFLDLVSNYVSLKKRGKSYVGLCPFHSEKTPSFYVDPEKKVFHCFGCGAGGGPVKFVELIENLSTKEAIEFLAQKVGIELKQVKGIGRLYSLMKEAANFFRNNLKKNNFVRDYLNKRGIIPQLEVKFFLGYSLDSWDALMKYLKAKGFSYSEMEKVGLVIPKKNGYYDRFRNRLMFPIFDIHNRIIGFGGRVLGEGEPKYLNSPATVIYNKSYELYGFNIAKKNIRQTKQVAITEGYFDCIKAHLAGLDITVATLGTALTVEHANRLKRLVDTALLIFDNDEAGRKATFKAINLLLKAQIFDVKVVDLAPFKDIDEFVENKGEDEFLIRVSQAVDYKEFLLKFTEDKKLSIFIEEIKEIIPVINIDDLNNLALMLADVYSMNYNLILEELSRYKKNERITYKFNDNRFSVDDIPEFEKIALKLYFDNEDMFKRFGFDVNYLSDKAKKLFEEMVGGNLNNVANIFFEYENLDYLKPEEKIVLMKEVVTKLRKSYKKRKIFEIKKKIAFETNNEKIKKLLEELSNLRKI